MCYQEVSEMILARFRQWMESRVRRLADLSTSDSARLANIVENSDLGRQIVSMASTTALMYENGAWQSLVLDTIDLDLIYANVDSNTDEDGLGYTDKLVRELLRYFRQDFFTWCDKPKCLNCDATDVKVIGAQGPNNDEKQWDCSVVEIFECNTCHSNIRFPRYNNPTKLLETRTGRCGEWCNLFMLILKSFGLEARYIWNKEDHVWCEYYSETLNRWVHVDSCEQSFDEPFIYSKNWNKSMSYVIAISRYGIMDVSRKYILQNALPRDAIDEADLQFLCKYLTARLRNSAELSFEEKYRLQVRDDLELISICQGQEPKADKSKGEGRISGSTEWKNQRGETGGIK